MCNNEWATPTKTLFLVPDKCFLIQLHTSYNHARNYKLYRNENSANFFLYADNGRIFKELFTPNLNGIAVSVQYVSSRPLILDAGSNDQLWRMQIKEIIKNGKKTEDSEAISKVEQKQ